MNQIYYVLRSAFGLSAKKQGEDFMMAPSPGQHKSVSYLTALLAVALFSCVGAYAQTTYYSTATATDFNNVASWNSALDGTGTAPATISNADNFVVSNSAALTLSGFAAVRRLEIVSGSLTVAGNVLSIGIESQKNSVLLINGGTLNVSGGEVYVDGYLSLTTGSFNQSGGAITIDPNNGGAPATSTTATQYTLDIRAAVNWTGGSITLLDPPASTSTSHYSLYYNTNTSSEVSGNHTIKFGDGVSSDAGGSTANFLVANWVGSGKLNFVNWDLYGPSANNRKVRQQTYANGVKGNLHIYPNAELDLSSVGFIVGGNITVDGTWTTNALVTLALASGTSSVVNPNAQTITGTGTFRNLATNPTANFASLTVNNSSAGGVTIDGTNNIATQPANSMSVSATLTFTAGKIFTTGGDSVVLGISASSNGTVVTTAGGFGSGSIFGRWININQPMATIAAGIDNTATAGRFPFVNAAGENRSAFIERTGTAGAAGVIAMTYNENGGASAVTLTEDSFTGTKAGNDNWSVLELSGSAVTGTSSFELQLIGSGMFGAPLSGSGVRRVQGNTFVGTHQAGTATPGGQRAGITANDITAAPFRLVVSAADAPVLSVASGDWSNPTTWDTGVVPTCAQTVGIMPGHTVTSNAAGMVAKSLTINALGVLTVTGGDLTVGCLGFNNSAVVNNGALSVSGGSVTINGSVNNTASSSFAQLGGMITIDGNNGVPLESVAAGTPLFAVSTPSINLSAGTLLFVDPHGATTAASGHTIAYNVAGHSVSAVAASPSHITQFGDGLSAQAGGHANGFFVAPYMGTGYLSLGTVIVNGGTGTNRVAQVANMLTTNGDLTVNAGSTLTAINITFGGNLTVDGTLVNATSARTGVVTTSANTLANFVYAPATIAQTISFPGAINNAATTPTGNFTALVINNTNAAGVTLAKATSVTGTLTLTEGIVNTTAAYTLTAGTATVAATLVGGSATAYVNGPFIRTIATGNTATNFLHFPVGKNGYAPVWVAPATTTVAQVKAEAFSSNSGTADASIINLSATRRWEVPVLSGAVTSINVRLGDAGLVATSIPVQAPAAEGAYGSAFGVQSPAAVIPNTVDGDSAIPFANYTGFLSYADANACTGTPNPGATVTSANNICDGNSVTLSVQNVVPGAGVSYIWQSSANGTDWTDIATATENTYTVTPTGPTYYRLKVTCANGNASSESGAIQINFSSSVTNPAPAARCGAGAVTLGATPSSGTITWFDAAVNGNVVATGNSYSPNVTTTTTYYAAAQSTPAVTAVLGAGTTTTSTAGITPFTSNYEGSRIQYLVKASELTAGGLSAGSLNSMAFDVTAASGYIQNGYTIKISHTAAEALTGYVSGTFTTVYGPVAIPVTPIGTKTFEFANAFQWDGTSNIVIEICHDNDLNGTCANCYGANGTVKYTATAFTSVYGRFVDNAGACNNPSAGTTAANSANRPNMVFKNNGCFSPRTAITATVNTPPALTLSSTAATICSGTSTAAITLTAGSTDYDQYLWTPSAGVTGDHVTGYVFSPLVSTSYTLNASQNAGALCTASATFDVTVNNTPTALTITDITSDVCVGSVTALTVTGGVAPATLTLGTATTLGGDNDMPTAFNNRFGGYGMQTIYTAAELTALGMTAGNINSIAFNVATLGSAATNTNYTVKIATTALSSFATTTFLAPTFATVFGPATYTHTATGWNTINFTTPYMWDGTSNIIVQISMNGANLSTNSQTYYTATVDNTVLSANNANLTTGTLSKNRLNIRFNALALSEIVWTPAANLYTDAAATTAYVGGEAARTVYVKAGATGNTVYTATATNPLGGCTATATETINAIDCSIGWGNLQWPPTGDINTCGTHTVYGRVWKDGVTDPDGAGVGIKAWVGVSTTNTDPATWTEAQWNMAGFNTGVNEADLGNNDEYKYDITGLTAGTYYYAFRYQYLTGTYLYGGYQGVWGGANVSGVLTVNAVAIPTAVDQVVCAGSTIANLAPSGTGINWYAGTSGGNALATTDVVTATTYYVSQTIDGCESARVPVAVTLSSFDAPVATVTQPTCSVATGTITVTSLGTGYTYSIDGTTFQSELEFTGVAAGNYTLTAKNSIGCTNTAAVTVNAQPATPAAATVTLTQPTCATATGTIEVTAPTGTGVTYSINGTDYQATATFTVAAGTYNVTVKNADGCISTATSAVINAQPVAPDAPTVTRTQPTCATATGTIEVTAPTGTGMTYSINGTDYQETATFTVVAGTYNVTAKNADGCVSTATSAVINAQPATPVVAPVADVSSCNSYTLPALNVGDYYTATNGGGTLLPVGTVLTETAVIYVYASNDGCSDEENFTVAITDSPELGTVSDVTACGSYTLPSLTVGSYYTQTGGTGTMLAAGTVISANQTIFVYAANGTAPACTSEESFDVTLTTAPDGPTGSSTQVITVSSPADATIEDLQATATGTVTWHATEANALAGVDALAAGTQLVDGTIYYAVNTVGTCRSTTALAVTASVVLGKDDFSFTNLKYYPNPVSDRLTITHSSAITSIEVYNLLGQLVISERPGTATTEVNMAQLQQATYIVRVSAEGKSKDFKVVKK